MDPNLSRPIFFPLVLVAAGVLWLLATFNVIQPGQLTVLLRFWPVLLIGLGLDLLLRPRWPWASNLVALAIVGLGVAAVLMAPRLGWAGADANWFARGPWMWIGGERGSGDVIQQTRTVNSFDGVSLSTYGEAFIEQGDAVSVRIEAEDNVVARLLTEVQGGTLRIRENPMQSRVIPTRPVRIYITVRDLSTLSASGAGSVRVAALRVDDLRATLSGAGSVTFEDLQAGSLDFNLSGAGSVTAVGAAERLSVNVSGVGSFNGGDLASQSAEARISGTGSATVWAARDLDASISGVGSVRYYGAPQVTERVSGLGRVQALGDR